MCNNVRNYKSITKKKKKKHDKIVLSVKFKLNIIQFLIYKVLIDSYISRDEFVLINNVLKEEDNKKEKIKTLENSTVH